MLILCSFPIFLCHIFIIAFLSKNILFLQPVWAHDDVVDVDFDDFKKVTNGANLALGYFVRTVNEKF